VCVWVGPGRRTYLQEEVQVAELLGRREQPPVHLGAVGRHALQVAAGLVPYQRSEPDLCVRVCTRRRVVKLIESSRVSQLLRTGDRQLPVCEAARWLDDKCGCVVGSVGIEAVPVSVAVVMAV
jgi:hypothetical protein